MDGRKIIIDFIGHKSVFGCQLFVKGLPYSGLVSVRERSEIKVCENFHKLLGFTDSRRQGRRRFRNPGVTFGHFGVKIGQK